MQAGRFTPWVAFMKQVLDAPLGAQFETATESQDDIHTLDKTEEWKLKGIVATATFKIFSKYIITQQLDYRYT